MDETLIQFDSKPAPAPQPSTRARRRGCATCGQQFSGDARFCPFDGEPLDDAPARDAAEDPLVGLVLDDRYEVQTVLGEGGMGTVYRARHTKLGRAFALKALRRDLALDKELAARFIQEARAAAAVAHPNVVQITDFGSLPSGQPYFVMEMLEGLALSELIRRGGPIPAARAVRILRQVAEALDAAHAAGIVHRDLKPDNIHVGGAAGDREVVKVLDFGLAKVAGASRLTRAGMVFGTPHYMSPEQASGEAVDHRSDVYALGVVMYEMFTGRVPFEADTYMGVLTKHMYMAPVPPSEVLGGKRELGALEDITMRCLEKKPAHRFASMGDLLDELDRIVHVTGDGTLDVRPSQIDAVPARRSLLADELEAPSPEELAIAMRRAGVPERRSRLALAGVIVALGAAATAVAWLAFRGPSAGPARVVASAAPPPASAEAVPALPVLPTASALPAAPVAIGHAAAASAGAPAPAVHAPKRPVPRVAAAPSAATSRPPSAKPPRKAGIGGSEIINPWAE